MHPFTYNNKDTLLIKIHCEINKSPFLPSFSLFFTHTASLLFIVIRSVLFFGVCFLFLFYYEKFLYYFHKRKCLLQWELYLFLLLAIFYYGFSL